MPAQLTIELPENAIREITTTNVGSVVQENAGDGFIQVSTFEPRVFEQWKLELTAAGIEYSVIDAS